MTEDYPNLMILSKLIHPIDLSLKKLQEIYSYISNADAIIVKHGLFVMAVSSIEIMMGDVLHYFLKSFPKKLNSNIFKFDKDTFLENYFTLLDKAIDAHIIELSYKSFDDFFNKTIEYLSLDWPDFFQTLGDDIKEIKATRNLLLHNNLNINEHYLNTAGPKRRSSKLGENLELKDHYLKYALEVLLKFEEVLKEKLSAKYKEYTKVNANKQLWTFFFKSPVMPYDDFWNYDESKDHISHFKKGKYEDGLSNSEMLKLSLWRARFSGNGGESIKHFDMRHFDTDNKKKILFFLYISSEFSFE